MDEAIYIYNGFHKTSALEKSVNLSRNWYVSYSPQPGTGIFQYVQGQEKEAEALEWEETNIKDLAHERR